MHAVGCRKFFNVTRDTQSYDILETYRIGERPRFTRDNPDGVVTSAPESRDDRDSATTVQEVRV